MELSKAKMDAADKKAEDAADKAADEKAYASAKAKKVKEPVVKPLTYEDVSSNPFGTHKDAESRPTGEIKPEVGPVPAK